MQEYNLTAAQKNISDLKIYFADTTISNICGSIIFLEHYPSNILCKAINKVIEMHEGLRLNFIYRKNELFQFVSDYSYTSFEHRIFKNIKELDAYAKTLSHDPFAVSDTPMYRIVTFDLEGKSGIIMCADHLICDAWTFSLIATAADKYCHALISGETITDTVGKYSTYILNEKTYSSSARFEKDRLFWENEFSEPYRPCAIKNELSQIIASCSSRYSSDLSEVLSEKIKSFCYDHGLTPAVIFESAVFAYLKKIFPDNETFVIGNVVLNRGTVEEKNTAGMFISTIPLKVKVTKNENIIELMRSITETHIRYFRHQKYPYRKIAEYVHKNSGDTALYNIMFSFQNAATDVCSETRWYSNGFGEVPFTIHVDDRDKKGKYTITIDYNTSAFDEEEISLFFNRFVYILEQIIHEPDIPIFDISLVPEEEYNKLIYTFNDTDVDYPSDKCVHELFSEQAAKTPDAVALVFEDKRFTYKQLDEMSNSLAHFLREEKGVKPNDIVAIIAKRSWHIIVAMLGILKAGGGYMPVDPSFPFNRISYMLDNTNCRFALTYSYYDSRINCIDLEDFDYSNDTSSLDNTNSVNDICYLIFTSGSTGRPKGVMLSHANVVNYADDNKYNVVHKIIKKYYTSIVSVTNIVFDIFVTESLLPLMNGLTIYFASDEEIVSQKKLSELISENNIDVMQTTPTKMRGYMLDENYLGYLKTLKAMILGGEILTQDLCNTIKKYTNAEIFNIYGPAETTVWSTNKIISREKNDITIGKPIANTKIYILDKNRQLLPLGVAGELCISGDGVGKGYLNNPELTAEKFIPDPFFKGKTMYCTGDLARWRPDGELDFLGRIDTQVKIRGLRIELGEIESVMSSFTGIKLCAVTDKRDENNRQYLVGYYTADDDIDEKALRAHLAEKLPKYMIPNYFVCLVSMPMTASGKTDRKSLPLPDFTHSKSEYVPPRTETEQVLCKLVGSILNVDNVGITDDFFDLGGDSLLAISLLGKLENSFDRSLSIRTIMERSVISELADAIDNADHSVSVPKTGSEKYTLLPQQKAIYAYCRRNPELLTYNMSARLDLSEKADKAKIKECLNKLFKLHPGLTSRIIEENNQICGVYSNISEPIIEEYNEQNCRDFVRPFDFSSDNLVRVGVTENSILFDMHHIIADGSSVSIILRDLSVLYNGGVPEKEQVGYADYAQFYQNEDLSEHKEFFKEMLTVVPDPLTLPETPQNVDTMGCSKYYTISSETAEAAKKYASKNGLTETMLLFGTFAVMLSKFSGKESVLTSIVLTNRLHRELQNTVGMFVNTLPAVFNTFCRTDEFFAKTKSMMLDIYKYQEIPFYEIADTLSLDKNIINTSFVYQANGIRSFDIKGKKFIPQLMSTDTSKFDITFEVTPCEEGLKTRIEYNSRKFDSELIDRLFSAYELILGQLEKEYISDISVITESEYNKLIYTFNDTDVDYPSDKCVHELFSEQAAKTPDAVALVFEDRSFTYRQLDEMSNSLAHYLREKKGVKQNDIVPIITKRSWMAVVAMLGIIKSGAAYLPIDISYPTGRIIYMLENINAHLILTYKYENELSVDRVDLRAFDLNYNTAKVNNLNDVQDNCYVLFTSGTTGIPKSLSISHKNLVNFTNANTINNLYQCSMVKMCKNVLALTTYVFDISIIEIFLTLINGLTLIMTNEEVINSSEKTASLITSEQIDVIHCTPTKFLMFLNDTSFQQSIRTLKIIMLGAENFTDDIYIRIRKYTNSILYNGYGPSETTVGVSFKKVLSSSDITIGKPIANTKIYILDKNRRLLPLGVAGELCISGDGVGKGYLNNPELTAEKFIPDPFFKGKTMYCTGDLARWRPDGELDFLGRIDTQVKIRGLRIELGEIESVMSSFTGIKLCAVTDKRDENNRQYLVGYYTADDDIDEKALRSHLAEKLPKYMIPNYFVRLVSMPMTASGKTDRKSLPLPDFTHSKSEYVPPRTETEQVLCELVGSILNVDNVGITDDFFDLGGDSLKAIEYIAKAHNSGIELDLQDIFDHPTVKELCEKSDKREHIVLDISRFEKYSSLLKRNTTSAPLTKKAVGNVFLTGATGFLGAHILEAMLDTDAEKIYCLVRDPLKLKKIIHYYFSNKYDEFIDSRIIAVKGDIELPFLSEQLPDDVQTVIHAAASVKHYGTYDSFEKINVIGTQNVINYAKKLNAALLHISTISVSGNSMADAFELYRSDIEKYFDESSLYIGQYLDNVYVRSKFMAECAVLDAMLDGLDAKILRAGNLTNRASDLMFQPNHSENAFLKRIKAGIICGILPDYISDIYTEFSPIDDAAKAVACIASNDNGQFIFHLGSNKEITFGQMKDILCSIGIPMDIVSGEEFKNRIEDLTANDKNGFIFEAFQNDIKNGVLQYDTNIRIGKQHTVDFLKKAGFEWTDIGLDYIRRYIEYFVQIGFLEVTKR